MSKIAKRVLLAAGIVFAYAVYRSENTRLTALDAAPEYEKVHQDPVVAKPQYQPSIESDDNKLLGSRHNPAPYPSSWTYTILEVSRNNNIAEVGFVADVQISKIIDEEDLASLARQVKREINAVSDRGMLHFYLPEMMAGNGAWAAVAFKPEIVVDIFGTSIQDEREIMIIIEGINDYEGLWGDRGSAGAFVIRIRRDRKLGYIYEYVSCNGVVPYSTISLRKSQQNGKVMFRAMDEKGEYFVVESNGDLSVYDPDGYVVTYKKVK